ncbi:MAG TPA: sortase [Spirillospora sp.]|nr:sortase [Spirillospora sp.]
MYRRQRSSNVTFIVVIVFGLAAGIGYLVYDNGLSGPPASIIPTLSPSPEAELVNVGLAATPTRVPDTAREITDGARFYAPTAGIAGDVIESYLNGISWDVTDLGSHVGHLQGTAWMDKPGNIVLAGHVEMSDGRTGIFASLDRLNIGDPVTLTQNGEERIYQVTQKFTTDPTDLTVLYPSQTDRLTLITCSAYDFLTDEYRERFVVIAERVS